MSGIHTLTMPKWGLSMSEGRVNAWLKGLGDPITRGEEIVEVESEKIAGALEAPASGVLRRRLAAEEDLLPVGALLGIIADADVADTEIDAVVAEFLANYVPPSEEEEGGGSVPGKIEVGGLRIRYLKLGAGGEPLILVHGFGGDLNNWLFNHATLAVKREVYALDLPGHGESTKDVADGSLDNLTDVVIGCMDALGIPAAHLIGHSMGGAVCLNVAKRSPQRVHSLVLIASAGLGAEINGDYITGFVAATNRRALKPLLSELFSDPGQVTRQLIDDMLKYKRLDGVAESLDRLAGKLFANGSQQMILAEVPEVFGKPVLVIWGKEDRIIPARHAPKAGGKVRVEILEGQGHMVQMEAANDVNRLMESFLA